ncbi:amidohydrolase [Methanothermococcus okinawensis]|uniref:S-adenosylhomocysteine deaminase n=1 Tax=Methanothermococcus okinawensis (strain DSM 14208 / JCM 11175 / IH1) TaxID=647113 RepID=F8ALF5_METOI|nr:amidohydrolase [Methanothermococcus okinawensis]AEH06544.1 S-adenosylhomocysteine deaminase [Methanothermococcus okinawensis IH1]
MTILVENLDYVVDKKLNVYKNVDILIKKEYENENENITKIIIGKNLVKKENLNKNDLKIINGKNKCAMPGLTNTHTHIPMTLLRGIADDMILQNWLNEKIWPNEAKLTEEDVYYGSLLGCLEMLRFGITSFNEMYFFSEEIMNATKQIGLKGVIGFPIIDFGTPESKDLNKLLKMAENFIKKHKNEKIVKPAIAPHAPYTCSKETYIKCKEIADEYNILLHTHISETRYEVVEMENNIKMRPVEYLENIGVLDSNVIGAHLVWITKDEVKKLARHNVKVSHCPGSNMKLASGGVMPLVEMLNEGVNVSIGTDGPASNNNLDILEEMKITALLHKAHRWDPTVGDVDTVLNMVFNSEILGFENNDIVLLDINSPHLRPVNNIKSNIVYSANGNDVDTVIVNGEVLLKNKKFIFGDKFLNDVYKKIDKIIKEKFNIGEN